MHSICVKIKPDNAWFVLFPEINNCYKCDKAVYSVFVQKIESIQVEMQVE